MLARLTVEVPFDIAISSIANFKIYGYKADDYIVRVLPPSYPIPARTESIQDVTVEGEPGVTATMLHIEFQKETLDLRSGKEPPMDLMQEIVGSLLYRLRHVMRSPQVKGPEHGLGNARIEYLNDDGTELKPGKGLPRARMSRALKFSWVAVTPKIWEEVNNLPIDYKAQLWDDLLIEAKGETARAGLALVLSCTALEVLIETILSRFTPEKDSAASEWAKKIRNKNPAEQYSKLLKTVSGHSLEEESKLWQGLNDLVDARNNFVHEGVAVFGKNRIEVDAKKTSEFIEITEKIVEKIRSWVPEEMRWKVFSHAADVKVTMMLLPAVESQSSEQKLD